MSRQNRNRNCLFHSIAAFKTNVNFGKIYHISIDPAFRYSSPTRVLTKWMVDKSSGENMNLPSPMIKLEQCNWNLDKYSVERVSADAPLPASPQSSHNWNDTDFKLDNSERTGSFVYLINYLALGLLAEFADRTTMSGWYFHRMLLLLQLAAYMLAYNDADQCQVCQTPLIQNPGVPWHRVLKNTTYYLDGLKYKKWSQSYQTNPLSLVLISRSVAIIYIKELKVCS